jgi:hypothetical protein
LTESTLPDLWGRLIRYLGEKSPILANHLKFASSPAIFGPNSLAIPFHSEYNHAREACSSEANTRRIAEALGRLTGQPARVRFDLATGEAPTPEAPTGGLASAADRKKQLMGLPIFKKAGEALGAQIWHVDDEFNPAAAPRKAEAGDAADTDTDPDEA